MRDGSRRQSVVQAAIVGAMTPEQTAPTALYANKLGQDRRCSHPERRDEPNTPVNFFLLASKMKRNLVIVSVM